MKSYLGRELFVDISVIFNKRIPHSTEDIARRIIEIKA